MRWKYLSNYFDEGGCYGIDIRAFPKNDGFEILNDLIVSNFNMSLDKTIHDFDMVISYFKSDKYKIRVHHSYCEEGYIEVEAISTIDNSVVKLIEIELWEIFNLEQVKLP